MKIAFNLGELKQTIFDLRNASHQITEINQNLEIRMNRLFSDWPQMDNKEEFHKTFAEWQQQISSYNQVLDKIADELQMVDDRFKEAQE